MAGDYDYLHLATHGSLNRNAPSLSALELEPDEENDGLLELHEIVGMKLRALTLVPISFFAPFIEHEAKIVECCPFQFFVANIGSALCRAGS